LNTNLDEPPQSTLALLMSATHRHDAPGVIACLTAGGR
jgi:hypothetical protein